MQVACGASLDRLIGHVWYTLLDGNMFPKESNRAMLLGHVLQINTSQHLRAAIAGGVWSDAGQADWARVVHAAGRQHVPQGVQPGNAAGSCPANKRFSAVTGCHRRWRLE